MRKKLVEVGINFILFRDGNPANRLLKKAAHCVLGRPSPCDVPQGYASAVALPAALLSAFLSSLTEAICIIPDHEITIEIITDRLPLGTAW